SLAQFKTRLFAIARRRRLVPSALTETDWRATHLGGEGRRRPDGGWRAEWGGRRGRPPPPAQPGGAGARPRAPPASTGPQRPPRGGRRRRRAEEPSPPVRCQKDLTLSSCLTKPSPRLGIGGELERRRPAAVAGIETHVIKDQGVNAAPLDAVVEVEHLRQGP